MSAAASAGKRSAKVRTLDYFFICFSLSRSTFHSTLDTRPFSLDNLIRPRKQFGWNYQTNLFCRLKVNHEFKLRCLLYG